MVIINTGEEVIKMRHKTYVTINITPETQKKNLNKLLQKVKINERTIDKYKKKKSSI